MYCSITLNIPPNANTIKALDLTTKVSTSTGEVKTYSKDIKGGKRVSQYWDANVKGLKFCHGLIDLKYNSGNIINIETLNLKGSTHKYHNDGIHNCDDYTRSSFIFDVYDLQFRYGVNPNTADLQTLEFGVNIRIPITVKEFVRLVKTYKRAQYKINPYEDGGIALYFIKQEYTIKIYSKGDQWNVGGNLLRFEVHIKKSEYLKRLGVNYLIDLTKTEVWNTLEGELLKMFNRLTICKEVRKDRLKQSEQLLLAKLKDKDFWLELSPNRYKHYRKSKLLKSGNELRSQISELIKVKCEDLRIQCH
jgi:hypothetical protein